MKNTVVSREFHAQKLDDGMKHLHNHKRCRINCCFVLCLVFYNSGQLTTTTRSNLPYQNLMKAACGPDKPIFMLQQTSQHAIKPDHQSYDTDRCLEGTDIEKQMAG